MRTVASTTGILHMYKCIYMTHSCVLILIHVWRDLFIGIWFIHMWHDLFICERWLLEQVYYICINVYTWLTHMWCHSFMCDMIHACVTWLIRCLATLRPVCTHDMTLWYVTWLMSSHDMSLWYITWVFDSCSKYCVFLVCSKYCVFLVCSNDSLICDMTHGLSWHEWHESFICQRLICYISKSHCYILERHSIWCILERHCICCMSDMSKTHAANTVSF